MDVATRASFADRAAPQLGTVRFENSTIPAIVFPGLRSDSGGLVRFAIGLVWMLVLLPLLLLTGEPGMPTFVGLAAVAVWATVFWPLALWNLRHDVGRIALTSRGVHAGTNSELFMPWEAIETARRIGRLWFSYVRIVVTDADAIREPAGYAVLRRINRRVSRKASTVEVSLIPHGHLSTVATAIHYYVAHRDERPAIGLGLSDGARRVMTVNVRPPWRRWAMRMGLTTWFGLSLVLLALAVEIVVTRLIGS